MIMKNRTVDVVFWLVFWGAALGAVTVWAIDRQAESQIPCSEARPCTSSSLPILNCLTCGPAAVTVVKGPDDLCTDGSGVFWPAHRLGPTRIVCYIEERPIISPPGKVTPQRQKEQGK
jgi:hypothetical protein